MTITVPPILRLGAVSAVLAVVVASLATMITTVAAQEGDTYTPVVVGDLVVEATSEPAPGVDVTLVGDGFAPDTTVELSMFSTEHGTTLLRTTDTTDAEGVASHTFTLPAEIVEGSYSANMSGVAADGAFVSLDTAVFIIGNTPAPTTAAATPTSAATSLTTAVGDSTAAVTPDDATASTAAPASDDSGGATATTVVDAGATPTTADGTSQADSSTDDGALPEIASDDGGGSVGIWIIIAAIVAALGGTAFVIRRSSFSLS